MLVMMMMTMELLRCVGQVLCHLAAGVEKWKKKKMQRSVVKRVLMAPPGDFTQQVLQDELAANPGLSVWGFLLEKDNALDMAAFMARICPDLDHEVRFGRVQPGVSGNLCKASAWTDPKVLNFGSEDIKVCLGWVYDYLHVFLFSTYE